MLELGVKFLISYFLGSIMGALVVGKLKGGVDIRQMGSGNAGGTNALRTQGWVFALGVVIIDVGKGALAAGWVPALSLPYVGTDSEVPRALIVYTCAAAGVAGHVWPIWYRFRGGKGAATLMGTFAALAPGLLIPMLLAFVLTLTLFGYVGLATMTAGVVTAVYTALMWLPAEQPLFIYALGCALYLIYTHRSNIVRMRAGTEPKNTKLMLFHKGGAQ